MALSLPGTEPPFSHRAWPRSPPTCSAEGSKGHSGPHCQQRQRVTSRLPAANDPSPSVPTRVFWTHPDPGRQAPQPQNVPAFPLGLRVGSSPAFPSLTRGWSHTNGSHLRWLTGDLGRVLARLPTSLGDLSSVTSSLCPFPSAAAACGHLK